MRPSSGILAGGLSRKSIRTRMTLPIRIVARDEDDYIGAQRIDRRKDKWFKDAT